MTAWLPFLEQLYGPASAQMLIPEMNILIERWREQIPVRNLRQLSAQDAMLITYGDQLSDDIATPLSTLTRFCDVHLDGLINCVHILPFYPYSSDDGFSVTDFRLVNPLLGVWSDITSLANRYHLMFDGVINHASAQGSLFKDFLNETPSRWDYFIEVKGRPDLSQVVRPRALPLLTKFESVSGEKYVWTTFSADQVDLNYHNPQVLFEMLDVLLFYCSQGAEYLRLDAIAYLWKEIGTSCIHLPQTHAFIRLLRAVLDEIAPHVRLITETNVPHAQNISYFGDGTNEAQLVYNFAMPPLVLHTLLTGDASALTLWAGSLSLPSKNVTFFNFLASHDGIGLNPVRGLLSEAAIDELVQRVQHHGGLVSLKQNPDGSQSPYELNINYFDALSDRAADESIDMQVRRFMAAQAILLSIVGLPGIYFHSLFGSRGWPQGVALNDSRRAINRQKFSRSEIELELADETSLRYKTFNRYAHLLRVRSACAAFDPHGQQIALNLGPKIFALRRISGSLQVLCLQNVSAASQPVTLSSASIDLLTNMQMPAAFTLSPYQTSWLLTND